MTKTSKANLLIISAILFSIIGPLALRLSTNLSLALGQYLFFLIPSILFMLINKMDIKSTLRLNPLKLKDAVLVAILTITIMPITLLISTIATSIFGSPISGMLEKIFSEMPFFFAFFCVALTPAICEEVVLRGVVLSCYKKQNVKTAIIMNGLLFGMFHLNLHQFFYTAFLGMIFAYVVWYTKSIFAGMLMHLINNGISVSLSYLPKNILDFFENAENTSSTLSNNPVVANILVPAVILIGSAVISTIILKKIKSNNTNNIENASFDATVPAQTSYRDLETVSAGSNDPSEPYNQSESEDRSDDYTVAKKESVFNVPLVILIVLFLLISALMQLSMSLIS